MREEHRPQWRNRAEGLLWVEALEAQFRAEWSLRLGEARRKRNEAELRRLRVHPHSRLSPFPLRLLGGSVLPEAGVVVMAHPVTSHRG